MKATLCCRCGQPTFAVDKDGDVIGHQDTEECLREMGKRVLRLEMETIRGCQIMRQQHEHSSQVLLCDDPNCPIHGDR